MRWSLGPMLAAGLALGACGGDDGPEVQRLTLLPDTLFIGPAVAEYAPGVVDDTLAIEGITGIAFVGDTLVVADLGGRVVLFDRELRPLRAYGQPGSGPGELLWLVDLAVHGDTILVSDSRNGRVAMLDLQGRHLGHLPLTGYGVDLVADAEGVLQVNHSGDHFFSRLRKDGAGKPLGPRPAAYTAAAGSPYPEFQPPEWASYRSGAFLAASAHGRTFLADGVTGDLLTFVGDSLAEVHGLPELLRTAVLATVGPVSHRGTYGFRQAYQALRSTPGGALLLAFNTRDAGMGLVVDPDTWEARPLVVSPGTDFDAGLSSAAFDGSLLVAARDRIHLVAHPVTRRR